MTRQVRCKGARMRIVGEMTVYTAAALQKQVLDGITGRTATKLLDLSEVSEMDTAGLQILLVARRHAIALGRELQVVAASSAVSDVLELLQLTTITAPAAVETNP